MAGVYVLRPNENWIVDQMVNDWYEYNTDISTKSMYDADVIWLMADWCYNQIDYNLLKSKKVITTIHHIVPEKFSANDFNTFNHRDQITTHYHVPNKHTHDFVKNITKKPITIVPYWANQNLWKQSQFSKTELREKYKIPGNRLIVGSFQRDTEGHDLISPKLEKGPDLLADILIDLNNIDRVFVVLAGWRRQFIISKLKEHNIDYMYIEKPKQIVISELYQCLDLYPVTSRYEGGPQALIECGLLDIPVVSRDIGMASDVLPSESIKDYVLHAAPSVPNVENLKLPMGFIKYRDLIKTITEL